MVKQDANFRYLATLKQCDKLSQLRLFVLPAIRDYSWDKAKKRVPCALVNLLVSRRHGTTI